MELSDYYLWMSSITGLELNDKNKLIKNFENPYGVWSASEKMLNESGVSLRVSSIIEESKRKFSSERIKETMYKDNVKYVSIMDSKYPEKLKIIDAAPIGLFYRGELPDDKTPAVAVIGARICSEYGRNITKKFVKELAEGGVQIISGLARGIDGHAHKSALSVCGKTYGILGTGLDIIYPKENSDIFFEMYSKGGVISEYYFGSSPLRNHFPERNRIIAGLSDCILVVEANKKSGTKITTDKALEQGKDVFVVPGRIGDILSEGCLQLARQGADIIVSSDDIAFCLRNKYPDWIKYNKDNSGQYSFVEKNNCDKIINFSLYGKNGLAKDERIVYALLSFKPKHFEQLMMESGLDYFITVNVINMLCKKGLAIETSSEYYIKSI